LSGKTPATRELTQLAYGVTGEYQSSKDCTSGSVGAALLTKGGHVYTGVCIDTSCGLGFCAEHSAIAQMLAHKESEIAMIVAVNTEGQVLPPCGRCRELIYQVNHANLDTRVIINGTTTMLLSELLPLPWQVVGG
jgi:cytidine deaminase